VLLLKKMQNALGAQKKLLSIAVGATSGFATTSYDIPNIAANVDFINLMTYDFHGSYDGVTGSNAALYRGPDPAENLNVDACVAYWLNQTAPADKLIVGIPTCGRSFTLAIPSHNGLGAPTIGPGSTGPFTAEPGLLAYNEFCVKDFTSFWQSDQRVPYAFKDNQWVSYDNVESVIIKSNYIVSNNLGGAMFWSLEMDDFRGNCGGGRFPLISASYDVIIKVR